LRTFADVVQSPQYHNAVRINPVGQVNVDIHA
jgi:hypothetical protein